MRYIFIDIGAYSGDSIKEFMDLSKAQDSTQNFLKSPELPVPPEQFDIYAFEPNPRFLTVLTSLAEQYTNIVEVSTDVAWIEDGISEFCIDPSPDSPMGSTIMKGKKYIWETGEVLELHTFDFSEWIKQFRDDYVIVKMDCEGAEFPILKKMIEDGTHKIMDQLWVETHPNKVIDYTTTDSNSLVERLREDILVELWH